MDLMMALIPWDVVIMFLMFGYWIPALVSGFVAEDKDQPIWLWIVLALVFGWFAVLILAAIQSNVYPLSE